MRSGNSDRPAYQLEDRALEGYAAAYRAYLKRRNIPGPEPTFADFVEIRRLQEYLEAEFISEGESAL